MLEHRKLGIVSKKYCCELVVVCGAPRRATQLVISSARARREGYCTMVCDALTGMACELEEKEMKRKMMCEKEREIQDDLIAQGAQPTVLSGSSL